MTVGARGIGSDRADCIHVQAGSEGRVHGSAALLEAAKSGLGAIRELGLRSERLVVIQLAASSAVRVSGPNTHITGAGLGRVDEAILVMSAIAVDMGQKVLGAVGRAAHVVGHLEDECS
jgi:hypothetical protein